MTTRLQVFTATWLSYAGFYVCRKVLGVVKEPLRAAIGGNDQDIAHLTTAFLVAYMFGQFATAALSRRLSNRALLLGGMAVSAFSNLAIGLFAGQGRAGYAGLLLAMSVHGLAQAVGWPANVGIMANWTRRDERGRVMAVWGTCYMIGAALAKAFAAFTFGVAGLQGAFWGSGVVLLAVVGLFFAWGREAPAEPPEMAVQNAAPERGATEDQAQFYRLVISLGLIYFTFKFVRYAVDSWAALVAREQFGLSVATAGYLSTAFDWLGFGGVLAAGWLSDRAFSGRRAPVIALGMLGVLVAAVQLWAFGLSSPWAFGALIGLIGFALMGPDSLVAGAGAMEIGGRRRAVVATGLINGLGSAGPIVQEEAIGWLKTHHGLDAVLLLLVAMAALGAASTGVFWLATRRRGLAV